MKILFVFVIVICSFSVPSKAQYVPIPDPWLKAKLMSLYPGCFNAQQYMDTTCTAILNETYLDIHGNGPMYSPIRWLNGIEYFRSLTYLDCSANGIDNLSFLPRTLVTLKCANQQTLDFINPWILKELANLPASLQYLDCHGNGIGPLPTLPTTLNYLDCSSQLLLIGTYTLLPELFALPSLPAGLTYLNCAYNALTVLPALPPNLQYLNCSGNKMDVYFEFSPTIHFDGISNLPTLPVSLLDMDIRTNNVSIVPPLPNAIAYLDVTDNPVNCLPLLPASMAGISPFRSSGNNLLLYSTGINCLPNNVPGMRQATALPVCNASNNTHGCAVAGPVPVKLTQFSVMKENNVVQIYWMTEQEINSKSFIVEKSADQNKWEEIAGIPAAGNSTEKLHYSTTDLNPAQGINYYRLKQIDIDGRFEYSMSRTAYFGNKANVVLFPNPATDKVTIYFPGNSSVITLQIFDANGRLVKLLYCRNESVVLPLAELSKGIYSIKISGKNLETVKKLIVK